MRISSLVLGLLALLMAATVMAQNAVAQNVATPNRVWVQIEAQPDLTSAMDRAHTYAANIPKVAGYKLNSGWYGISLGPMTSDEAVQQLNSLIAQNAIPADSYITDGASFGTQFWPVAGQASDSAAVAVPVAPDVVAAVAPPVAPAVADETVRQAKAGEAALSVNDRQDLQTAMRWFGFYNGKVDGNFGAGTRASMASWQSAQGFDPTGVLTSSQRKALVEGYKGEEATFGFETVTDAESGIEISLPMALLAFDRYTPPFVRYNAKTGAGVTAMLISEPGTKASLASLYDILQSLDIVPQTGERALGATSFRIVGKGDKIETVAYAEIDGTNVKGYLLSWDVALSDKMNRVLPFVQSSFRSSGDKSMDPGLVPLEAAVKRGLLAGLDVKKPKLSRSGFFIDTKGSVLTTAEATAQCGKITLDRSVVAKVTFADKASGVVVLTPDQAISPTVVANFASAAPEAGEAVAVSGYSYEGRLPAPVLTRGTLEEAQGLHGETGVARLTMAALAGDAGGPVLDASGAVVGLLLPADQGAAQQLPKGVAFAMTSAALTQLLTNTTGPGMTLNAATPGPKATPDALNAAARGMTVLVSCWE